MTAQILAALLLALTSCSGVKAPAKATLTPEDRLPLPSVPDSLTTPPARAGYVISHFWDAMDFSDTTLTHSPEFMERNFVDFLSVYPHAPLDSLAAPTKAFLTQVTADPVSRGITYELMCRYLGEPHSPVYSDSVMTLFLEQWLTLPGLNEYELEEPRYRLHGLKANAPGTTAADFDFSTPTGHRSSLSRFAQNAPHTILLFYDPDCDHCTHTIQTLRSSTLLERMITAGKIQVLAVYPESDRELWRETAPLLPTAWTVAADESAVLDSGTYFIPEMPGIYLLDSSMKVVLRHPKPEELFLTLTKL